MGTVQEYVDAFRRGYLGEVSTQGLLGRVIRGKTPKDFETLSDDPDRRLILLTDPQGLSSIVGKSAFSILIAIGWEPGYAIQKVTDGFKVKLVVCKEGGLAQLATWDGVMTVLERAYPEISDRIRRWLPQLKRTKFDDIETRYGCDMSAVDHDGKTHPKFMTLERYLKADDNLENARAFLYFTVHLREQYAGDGYTYDDKGNRGMPEYMAPNCKISELLDGQVVDLEVQLPAACTIKPRRLGSPKTGFPSYYKPEDVGRRYQPRFDWVTEEAKAANLTASSKDKVRRLLVGIDFQDDFVTPEIKDATGKAIQPPGSLLVTGAVDDIRRLVELIYNRPDLFSGMLFTMDQHLPFQIFYQSWWRDRNGNQPAPFTLITDEQVEAGDFRPVIDPDWTRKYMKIVKAQMIWPYHCMIGTEGSALVPALTEAIHWLSVGRSIQPMYMFKGTVPQTEHYGPFCPCVEYPSHPQGTLNTIMLDQIAANDEIVFTGEAEDFCVKQGMTQVLKYFGQRHQGALKKVRFVRDCTSMVFPNKRQEADEFLNEMESKGIIVTTTSKLA